MKTVKEIAHEAADNLERYGWRQGCYGVPGQPQCIAGACRAAAGIYIGCDNIEYLDKLLNLSKKVACAAVQTSNHDEVIEWNDTPGRTAEEVITALRGVK